ncbi:hypothetical protein [Streptomyces sp. NPDC006309]|uniref:hypothetical protein n=1 Tax=Streptomyces sp. NPDC006309 TaxID=3156749 RepID=UPI0033AB1D1E
MPDNNDITPTTGPELEPPAEEAKPSAQGQAASDVEEVSHGQAIPQAVDLGSIPATITVTENPAVTDTRDALLKAIGQEAQHVADKSAGQASAALEQLARAYVLVAANRSAAPARAQTAGRVHLAELAPPNGSPIGDDYAVTEVPKPNVRYYE